MVYHNPYFQLIGLPQSRPRRQIQKITPTRQKCTHLYFTKTKAPAGYLVHAPRNYTLIYIKPREILHGRPVHVNGGATSIKTHQLVPTLRPNPSVVARLLSQRQGQAVVRNVPAFRPINISVSSHQHFSSQTAAMHRQQRRTQQKNKLSALPTVSSGQ